VVTLWDYVEHHADGPPDGLAAGRALRVVHDLLADFDARDLPVFPRLDEVRRILPTLDVDPAMGGELAEMLELAEVAAAALDAPVQAVHGDAWLGNVLHASTGPLWNDFELACVAPRELDLACNETSARDRGRTGPDDAFLAGYGDHDVDLRVRLERLEVVPLTAWTFQLAATKPAYLDHAKQRLTWALAGLRG
jgi:aminoglycoside phosphotransferase (APT) family kinase protein